MKLYTHIDRVYRELAELGKKPGSPLDAAEISAFDQMHYHGTVSVSHAIDKINIAPHQSVLEIGSGFGGPARHIVERTGAQVTALELQTDQNALAMELTERCGMSGKINHICGDFLCHHFDEQTFDHIVSWLAVFHIPDRYRLLKLSHQILKPRGVFFAEDLYSRNPMEEQAFRELATAMYASYLPDMMQYKTNFEENGFEIVDIEEMSDDWTEFTTLRLDSYRQMRDRHIRVHGEAAYIALEEFYDLVNRHFRSGKLGGLRIMARKINQELPQ